MPPTGDGDGGGRLVRWESPREKDATVRDSRRKPPHWQAGFTAVVIRHAAGGRTAMVEYVKAMVDLFLTDDEEGQGLVEYALILVLISIAAIAIMTTVGTKVKDVFTTISTNL
jgi:pilus assembly protein Flp/PilA